MFTNHSLPIRCFVVELIHHRTRVLQFISLRIDYLSGIVTDKFYSVRSILRFDTIFYFILELSKMLQNALNVVLLLLHFRING